MAKQDKGNVCACGCGERKSSRKRKFLPGHSDGPPKPQMWAVRLAVWWLRPGKH